MTEATLSNEPTVNDEERPSERPALQFIRDEPADDDYFETHTKLAKAIANTVVSNPLLRTIGLLGRWGSGKSTVLRQLEKELPAIAPKRFRIFTYDAWLHQHDPVRRSFIEELVAFAEVNSVSTTASSGDTIKELLGQVQTTDVEITPRLTFDAKILLLSLMPVPLGLALMRLDVLKGVFGRPFSAVALYTFLFAVFAILTPVWSWIFMYFARRPWRTIKGHFWPLSRAGAASFFRITDPEGRPSAIIPALINQSVKRTSTRTVSSPEPTTIEFSSVFRSIVRELSADGHRLVVVVDNLDRVPEDEALQIWATIRSFFSRSEQGLDEAQRLIDPLVILPVDRTAIQRMFARSHGSTDATELADSFVQKTFEVTFEVTQPVMSDWRNFLEKQMEEAFGSHIAHGWKFWTRKFLESRYRQKGINPTPRQINRFINRLMASYMQWGDDAVCLPIQAFYIAHQDRIEENFATFVTSDQSELAKASPLWQQQIAALFYGVPVEKSIQTLLDEPLSRYLQSGRMDLVSPYFGVPGFDDSLESLTADPYTLESGAANGFVVIRNFTLLVEAAGRPSTDAVSQAWRNISTYYTNMEQADLMQADAAKALSLLAPNVPASLAGRFIATTVASVSAGLQGEKTKGQGELRAIATSLIAYAKERDRELPTFDLGEQGPRIIHRLFQAGDAPLLMKQYRSSISADDLDTAFSNILRDPLECEVGSKAFDTILGEGGSVIFSEIEGLNSLDWPQTSAAATEFVRRSLEDPQAAAALRVILSAVGRVDSLANVTGELANDGTLSARLAEAVQAEEMQQIASLVAVLIKEEVDFSIAEWSKLLRKGPELPKQITKALRGMIGPVTIYAIWDAYDKAPAARETIRSIVEYGIKADDLGRLHTSRIMDNMIHFLRPVHTLSAERFIEIVSGYEKFWENLPSAEFSKDFHKTAAVLVQNEEKREKVEEVIRAKLATLTEKDWTDAIKTGAEPYPLLLEVFQEEGLVLSDKSVVVRALHEFVPDLLTADRASRLRWWNNTKLLGRKQQKALLDDVATALLLGQSGGDPLGVFKVIGEPLLLSAVWGRRADETVTQIILRHANNRPGRAWLKSNSSRMKIWIARSSPAARSALRSKLQQMLDKGAEESRYWSEVCLNDWRLADGP